MKPILFEKSATIFTNYGLGVLPDAISCIVTEERNGAFELEMAYPVTGVLFDELIEDRIIVAKARENGTKQAFRIYRITRELAGQVTVYARHVSYQLNFIPVPPVSGNRTAQAAMRDMQTNALEPCIGDNIWGGLQMKADVLANVPTSAEGTDPNGSFVKWSANATTSDKVLFDKYPFKENTRYTLILAVAKNNTNPNTNLVISYTDGSYSYANIPQTPVANTKYIYAASTQANKTVRRISTIWGSATVFLYYEECGLFEGVLSVSDFVAYTGAPPFHFYSDIAGSNNYDIPTQAPFRTMLGGMESSILDVFGGEYEWDNWDVKLWQNRGSDKGVVIKYGKNLTALERTTDIGDLITGVAAFWQGEDADGVATTVYTSPRVISNADRSNYAFPRTVVLDCSQEFDEVPTQAQLTTYATAYLATTTLANVSESVSVDFVPLWHTSEYKNTIAEHIDLCDTVTVFYERLGVNVKKKVTKTIYDVLVDRYQTIELGSATSIADTIADLENQDTNLGRDFAKLASAVEVLRGKIIDNPLPVANGGTGATSVGDAYKVAYTNVSDTASRAAGATYNLTKAVGTLTGYTPVCVCGWGSTGMTYLSIANLYLDSGGDIHITGRNLGSSAVTPEFNVRVLYAKTT